MYNGAMAESTYLESIHGTLKPIIQALSEDFDFCSVLGTDCTGTNFEVYPTERRAAESMWTERGLVFRAAKNHKIVEYSYNGMDLDIPTLRQKLLDLLDGAPSQQDFLTMDLEETAHREEYSLPGGEDPLEVPPAYILDRLEAIRRMAADFSSLIVMARTRAEWVRVSKLYLSTRRDLYQSYLWGQAYVATAARRDGNTRSSFIACSGCKGLELLEELEKGKASAPSALVPQDLSALTPPRKSAALTIALLDAVSMEPGEYRVLLSPDMAGMLAHEAFGHGVETDMMAKGRSRALHYIGKTVGSELVTMYDDSRNTRQTGSYHFDDEGCSGGSTKIIDRGILRSGISDLLSAKELNAPATGNGRRWSYERKAYARMSNTFFAPGESTEEKLLEDVEYGWLLDHPISGMEDPKNWGIQLVALVGREIRNGKLTGKISSPVVCSGYVPEVLEAVDAVGPLVELAGNGYCGKGHKEFVKVSSGGPWIRTRMSLG